MTGPAYDPNDPITHVQRAIRLLQAFAPDALPAKPQGTQPNAMRAAPAPDAPHDVYAGAPGSVERQVFERTGSVPDPTLGIVPLADWMGGPEARGVATVGDALNAAERALTAIPHDHAAYETAQAALGRINRAREVGTGVDALGEDAAQHIRNAMTPLQGMQQMGEGHPAFDEALTHLRGALQPPASATPQTVETFGNVPVSEQWTGTGINHGTVIARRNSMTAVSTPGGGYWLFQGPEKRNIGTAFVAGDGEKNFLSSVSIEKPYRRQGAATFLYDAIEAHRGRTLDPSPLMQTDDAKAFWAHRLQRPPAIDNAKVASAINTFRPPL